MRKCLYTLAVIIALMPAMASAQSFPVDAITLNVAQGGNVTASTLLSAATRTVLYISMTSDVARTNQLVIFCNGTTIFDNNAVTYAEFKIQTICTTAITYTTAGNGGKGINFSITYVNRDISLLAPTVGVVSLPAITGTVGVNNFPASQAVTGTFWPVTQPVSGTVAVSNFPATQPVSGSLSCSVSNFPATQPVSGTVGINNFPATQPVSGTVAVSNFPEAASTTINIGSTTVNAIIASSTPYTGASLSEWLFIACIFIFMLSLITWRSLFSPIKKMYDT
jgi:hypothetical protein